MSSKPQTLSPFIVLSHRQPKRFRKEVHVAATWKRTPIPPLSNLSLVTIPTELLLSLYEHDGYSVIIHLCM